MINWCIIALMTIFLILFVLTKDRLLRLISFFISLVLILFIWALKGYYIISATQFIFLCLFCGNFYIYLLSASGKCFSKQKVNKLSLVYLCVGGFISTILFSLLFVIIYKFNDSNVFMHIRNGLIFGVKQIGHYGVLHTILVTFLLLVINIFIMLLFIQKKKKI